MEVETVLDSSLSKVKGSGSEKKKKRKNRKHQEAIENGNAESNENLTCVGTYSNHLESGLKEEADSSIKGTLSKKYSVAETLNSVSLEAGFKQNPLNEQPACSEGKRKRRKELKAGSVVELTDRNESSLIDEKQRDSDLQSGLKGVTLTEQPVDSDRKNRKRKRKKDPKKVEELNQKSVVELIEEKQNTLIRKMQNDLENSKLNVSLELGLKEREVSLMKDALLERNLHVDTLNNISLDSGLNGGQLNEQRDDSKRKRKRRRKDKMAKAEQLKKVHANSVLELGDRKENSSIDERQSDYDVDSKVNVNFKPELNEGAHSDLGAPENISLEFEWKDIQSNEQMAQPERKRKRKRKKKKKKQKKQMLCVLEDKDNGSKMKDTDCNEEENNNMHPEPQIPNKRDLRKKDLMSIPENVESKHMQNDPPQTVSTSMVKTQNLCLDGSPGVQDIKDIKTLQIEKTIKTYSRKRKKSSKLFVDNVEHIQENGMIQISTEDLKKEHTTASLENGSHVLVEHSIPAQVMAEAGNSTGSKSALKRRKRKKKKKLKESLCQHPDQKNVELDRICISRPKKKLLVLDLNGILVDVVQKPGKLQPDLTLAGKGVFRRPFWDDFLTFCFSTFNVGIWSSRIYKNTNRLVSFLMKEWRKNLLFIWDRKYCTITKYNTIEDQQKPLVLKELRKLWEKHVPNLPWEKGEYDESNTLLLDDSPYKALRNPANTAVFPYPYQFTDSEDSSLAHGGDIQKYLEGVAAAENVQKYVEQNPFGQPAITESSPDWDFYRQILDDYT